MKRSLWVVALLALTGGCDDSGQNQNPDLAAKKVFDASLDQSGAAIGAECTTDANCKTGTMPSCFKAARGTGFCTANCQTDADCGSLSSCITFSDGKFCMRNCQSAADCSTGTGFACWIGLGCFRASDLDCDPTMAYCSTAKIPQGGCLRQAVGTSGKLGICNSLCTVGPGTCPPNGTNAQTCLVFDETTDSMGMATGDKFKGTVCTGANSTANQHADGTECLFSDGNHYIDLCKDGSECDVFKGSTNPAPTNNCYPLCYAAGYVIPQDAGIPDGGAPAMTCATGCKDAFGLFGSSNPVGLCKP
jgi:hypothetical protein